jgi:hypothetical protein
MSRSPKNHFRSPVETSVALRKLCKAAGQAKGQLLIMLGHCTWREELPIERSA